MHPRYYGNFPRRIKRYAMDEGIVPVEDAVRAMTSLPAQILGLRDRGQVREGFSELTFSLPGEVITLDDKRPPPVS